MTKTLVPKLNNKPMQITIEATSPLKIPAGLNKKWKTKLVNVKSLTDKTGIIFLGEVLQIITGTVADFKCSGMVDYDMFSGCDFAWSLTCNKITIIRKIKREISESWQRVEVETDETIIKGMPELGFKWNGESGGILSELKISFKLSDSQLISQITDTGKQLYSGFVCNY